jgi:hypothetical protein
MIAPKIPQTTLENRNKRRDFIPQITYTNEQATYKLRATLTTIKRHN